jgi:hypothetical protein
LLFLVVYWLILRPVKKQAITAFRELPGKLMKAATPALPAGGGPALEAAVPGEGQKANQLKKMLTEKIKAEPAAASRLVESWVKGDDK